MQSPCFKPFRFHFHQQKHIKTGHLKHKITTKYRIWNYRQVAVAGLRDRQSCLPRQPRTDQKAEALMPSSSKLKIGSRVPPRDVCRRVQPSSDPLPLRDPDPGVTPSHPCTLSFEGGGTGMFSAACWRGSSGPGPGQVLSRHRDAK